MTVRRLDDMLIRGVDVLPQHNGRLPNAATQQPDNDTSATTRPTSSYQKFEKFQKSGKFCSSRNFVVMSHRVGVRSFHTTRIGQSH